MKRILTILVIAFLPSVIYCQDSILEKPASLEPDVVILSLQLRYGEKGEIKNSVDLRVNSATIDVARSLFNLYIDFLKNGDIIQSIPKPREAPTMKKLERDPLE